MPSHWAKFHSTSCALLHVCADAVPNATLPLRLWRLQEAAPEAQTRALPWSSGGCECQGWAARCRAHSAEAHIRQGGAQFNYKVQALLQGFSTLNCCVMQAHFPNLWSVQWSASPGAASIYLTACSSREAACVLPFRGRLVPWVASAWGQGPALQAPQGAWDRGLV